jgi:hypothetical protein
MYKKNLLLCILFIFGTISSTQGADVTFNAPVIIGEVPFYIGFGSGKLFINGETISDIKGNDNNYIIQNPYYITAGMSGPVNKNLHTGAEISFFRQSAKPRDETDPTYSHELLSFILSVKYFPEETGYFTKFGLGWCQLDSVEDLSDPNDTDIHETYDGYTALIGFGYEVVGPKFHVGINLEYSRQTYNDSYDTSGTLIDNSNIYSEMVTLSIRLGWY